MAASAAIQRIFSGQTEACAIRGTSGARPRILLSGAFNPLHQGHRKMALIATELIVAGQLTISISLVLLRVQSVRQATPTTLDKFYPLAGRF